MAQLEYYRIFEAVARNSSFSLAAQELYITQPAVSQSIRRLENELGTELFMRTSRGVVLTQSGKVLYDYVGQALSLISGAENHMSGLQSLERGALNIGASDTLCRHYLLPFLHDFHEKYPSITLKVTNRTSGETVELLKQGEVDLGFVNTPTQAGANMTIKALLPLHDTFVYSPRHFPDTARTLDLAEVAALPLMMLEQESSTRKYLDAIFREQGIKLRPQIALGSHDLLLSFAEIGLGVAAVVREYSRESLSSGLLRELRLSQEIPPREVGLVCHDKLPLTPAAQAFIRLMGV